MAAFADEGAGCLEGALPDGAADVTAAFAMVLLTGRTGLVALTAAVFTGVLLVLVGAPAFTEAVVFWLAALTWPAFPTGFVTTLADDFCAGLAAGLLVEDTLGPGDDMRA